MPDASLDLAALRRAACGQATPEERAALRARLETDPAAAKQYRTLVEAERALAGGPLDIPGAVELEALLPGVLDAVAPKPRRAPLFAAVPALVAVAAAAALFITVRSRDDHDAFSPRGGAANAGGVAPLALEVFCVEGEQARALPLEGGRCPVGASLVVAAPRASAGAVLELAFVDASGAHHAARGGPDARSPDAAPLPADGVSPLRLELSAAFAPGPGAVMARLLGDGGTDAGARQARRTVEIVPRQEALP